MTLPGSQWAFQRWFRSVASLSNCWPLIKRVMTKNWKIHVRGISHVCCNAICHNSSCNSGNSSAGISMAMNGRIVERNKHLHSVEVITTTWLPTHQFRMISRKYQVTSRHNAWACIQSDKSNKAVCTLYIVKCSKRVVEADIHYTVQYQYQRTDSVELQKLCKWLWISNNQ